MSSNGPPPNTHPDSNTSPPPPKKTTDTKLSKPTSTDKTSEFITGVIVGDLLDETS